MTSIITLQRQNDFARLPFWGSKVPRELKFLQQTCIGKVEGLKIDRNLFREILRVVVLSIEQNENIQFEIFQTLSSNYGINLNQLVSFYSSVLKLCKVSMRLSSIKQEIIKEDLIDQLKLPSEFAQDFVKAIYSQRRSNIEQCLQISYPQHPKISKLNWRVDVSISTSTIKRSLEPTIILKLILSNDKVFSFEMSLNKFHLLRFNIASILREIADLENRQIFKMIE